MFYELTTMVEILLDNYFWPSKARLTLPMTHLESIDPCIESKNTKSRAHLFLVLEIEE